MIVFACQLCRTSLSADAAQAGQLVRCPTCLTAQRVPDGQSDAAPTPVAAAQAGRSGVKRYGFHCGYCSSRLEATEAVGGQEGQCPTCGNTVTIPILDRYGRLIDPKTRQVIRVDPHPVHAYAAAGDRAPRIVRADDGAQAIRCPRCGNLNPVAVNNCRICGMPFTMEGTTVQADDRSNGFAVASLVLGIIGIPAACAILPSVLAILFGVLALVRIGRTGGDGGGRGMAIAGLVCGGAGVLLFSGMLLG